MHEFVDETSVQFISDTSTLYKIKIFMNQENNITTTNINILEYIKRFSRLSKFSIFIVLIIIKKFIFLIDNIANK